MRPGSGPRRLFVVAALLLLLVPCGAAANPFARGEDRPRSILNIAHGGASSTAPQNTLAAGRKAFELGADVWGVDVRLTGDGVFVLMHDETLSRTTDVADRFPTRAPWRVDEFTVAEIRTLDAGSWFVRDDPFGQIEAGRVSRAELESFTGEPVPTLREALELVAEQRGLLDIEVKPSAADPDRLARRLTDLIEATGTAERVMISSFDHDLLRAIQQVDPTLPTGALAIFSPSDPTSYLDSLGADVYLPSLVGYTNSLLEELRAAGIAVHVWTYNGEGQLERLAQTPGIRGIYTDFPQRLEPILERLGHDADG